MVGVELIKVDQTKQITAAQEENTVRERRPAKYLTANAQNDYQQTRQEQYGMKFLRPYIVKLS